MIRYVRSARSIYGRGGEAIQWATEVAGYVNTQYPEVKLTVFTVRFGSMNDIYWYADLEDLAALDRWQKQIAEDRGYRDLRRKAVDLFVQDSVQDRVLSSVSMTD
jgi:hypothetical protein